MSTSPLPQTQAHLPTTDRKTQTQTHIGAGHEVAERGWSSKVRPLRWRTQRVVGAGLDFGRRWAVRSGRHWARLRTALGSEEWSALSFGATDWLERPVWLKWRTGRGRKRKKEEKWERERKRKRKNYFFNRKGEKFNKITFFLLDVMNSAHLFIDVHCSNEAKFFRFSSIAAATRFLCLWS